MGRDCSFVVELLLVTYVAMGLIICTIKEKI